MPDVQIREVAAARLAVLSAEVNFDGTPFAPVITKLYDKLYTALGPDAGAKPGHNVIAYQPTGEKTADVMVGRHWEGPLPDGIESYELPAGRAAVMQHVGPYVEMHRTHMAVVGWLIEQGVEQVGLNWEVYGDWNDDPAKLVTDVYYLLA